MIDKIIKYLKNNYPQFLNVCRKVRYFIWHQYSKKKIRYLIKDKKIIWLNIGSGDNIGEKGWTTIDITKNCDICSDIRYGIPFPDESVGKIYSSHFLEHLSIKEINNFLNECRRVLVAEGSLSICVPNARYYIEAYYKTNAEFKNGKIIDKRQAKLDYINQIAYMGGSHKYMFDEENILYLLRSNGFRKVHLRNFNPEIDLEIRDFESIYAEANK
jgi:predicted SAM-dependent methyltransferase